MWGFANGEFCFVFAFRDLQPRSITLLPLAICIDKSDKIQLRNFQFRRAKNITLPKE